MTHWTHEPIDAYSHERDEMRSARAALTEMDRAVNCRHSRIHGAGCADCGFDIRGELGAPPRSGTT